MAFSPDGERLAVLLPNALRVDGWPSDVSVVAHGLAWRPDGAELAVVRYRPRGSKLAPMARLRNQHELRLVARGWRGESIPMHVLFSAAVGWVGAELIAVNGYREGSGLTALAPAVTLVDRDGRVLHTLAAENFACGPCLSVASDAALVVWDLMTGEANEAVYDEQWDGRSRNVTHMAFCCCGRYLATAETLMVGGSVDVRVWDRGAQPVATVARKVRGVSALAWRCTGGKPRPQLLVVHDARWEAGPRQASARESAEAPKGLKKLPLAGAEEPSSCSTFTIYA